MTTSKDKILDEALMSPGTVFIENIRCSNYPRPYWLIKNLLGKKIIMPMKAFRPLARNLIETRCSHLSFGSEKGDAFLDPRLPKRLLYLNKRKNPHLEISAYTNLLKLDHYSDEEIGILLGSINTIYIEFTPQGFFYKHFYRAGYFSKATKNLYRLLEQCSKVSCPANLQVINWKDGKYNLNMPEMKVILKLLEGDQSLADSRMPLAWGTSNRSGKPTLLKLVALNNKEAIYPCWYIRNPRYTVDGNLPLCRCIEHDSRAVSGDSKRTVTGDLLNTGLRRQLLAEFLNGSVPPNCLECPFYVPDQYFNLNAACIISKVLASEPTPLTFKDYTFPKKSHFKILKKYGPELFSNIVDPETCAVKVYQNLLVLAFLKMNISPGSRILEVGGGNSLILSKIYDLYECWNVDKFEGLGQGPKEAQEVPYKNVYAYMGEFSQELPADYFDFVFSISALEHVEPSNKELNQKILADIDRVLKSGGYSLHSLDVIIEAMLERSYYDYIYHYLSLSENVSPNWAERFKIKRNMWENREVYIPDIVHAFFNAREVVNTMPAKEELICLIDVWTMSEQRFAKNWQPVVKRPYQEVGRPTAINVLWQKRGEISV